MKYYSVFLVITIISILSSLTVYFYGTNFILTKADVKIIWWTQFYNNNESRITKCGNYNCIISENRNDAITADAFMFYGSNFDPTDLPLSFNHFWALLHEESPRNKAILLHEECLTLFNLSATFSRFSDFPLTLQYLPNESSLIDNTYYLPVEQKNAMLTELAPVLYIQSDCNTPTQRDDYVKELMKYIKIDSYGKCLNNKVIPEDLKHDPLNNLYSENLIKFIANYKFVIAFENSVCNDYITEKLWRPLIAGSIPIYKGSPTVQDWLPNEKSVILVDDFHTPKELSEYILKLNSDDQLYQEFLIHKTTKNTSNRISNHFLIDSLSHRNWDIFHSGDESIHFITRFECFICTKLHKMKNLGKNYKVKQNHYECPFPTPLILNNTENWWIQHWQEGKCEAKALNHFVLKSKIKKISREMFNKKIELLKKTQKC